MSALLYEGEGEKMSGVQNVWSEKKMPKNIRQIGETEGQNRIYLEDYVYTYIRKALEKRSSQVVCGVLAGTWEEKETGRCYFIKSAMVVEGLLSAKESMIAGTPLWKKTRELAEYYFPGQEYIGWFLHSREEGFFDQTELTQMHQHLFPEGEALLFLLQEEDSRFYFGAESRLEASGGFYIYYEKNGDMQNYMLETGQSASEEVTINDSAILQYRSIMQERKNQLGRKQETVLKRVCLGLAAAVVFLSVYTWREQILNYAARQETESGQALEAGAAVGAGETSDTGKESGQQSFGVEETVLENVEASVGESVSQEEISETVTMQESTDGQGKETEGGESAVSQNNMTEPAVDAAVNNPGNGMNYYEVQSGDTLVGICLAFYGTTDMLPAICQMNGISNPALIYNGQRIYLP